jgi:predicted ArsR family transcriptional regulator
VQRTRREILNILKKKGRATLEELATGVGLVPVTVRAHLNVLERDDLVQYEEVRGKVGRPYYVYSLTEDAEALFPKNYHTLANRVLDGVAAAFGGDGVEHLAEVISDAWLQEKEHRLVGKSGMEIVQEVAKIRAEEGTWAEVEHADDGSLAIVQYNCPCPQVASKHSEVTCAAELRYMRKMLGAGVERVEWSQTGSRVCRFMIPGQPTGGTAKTE